MIVAAVLIDPPEGDRCFAFHVVNDSDRPIDSIWIESVDWEWGDFGGGERVSRRFGPVAPGASVVIHKETDTEVRASATLFVRDAEGDRRLVAEFPRLYRSRGEREVVPVLGRKGMVASIEVVKPPAGTVEIDDLGARRWLEGGRCEAVGWDELVKVEILTTDLGPAVADVFWVLHRADGKGCVVPSEADPGGSLLARLQKRPGFDNEAVTRAMASTTNSRFPVWEKV